MPHLSLGRRLQSSFAEDLQRCSHAIVSTSTGPEYYVNVHSIVDKGQLEPGCSVLLHSKVLSVVGLLSDEADPMVSVMKVEISLHMLALVQCTVIYTLRNDAAALQWL